MITCPQCGVVNKNTANFCGNCGAALRPAQSAPPIPPIPSVRPIQPIPSSSTDQPAPQHHQPRQIRLPPPSPPLSADQPSPPPQPGAALPSAPSGRARLLGFSALLAVAGLVLIFVVAPEYTEFQRLIFNYGVQQYDPEYWMAMVGGGVCLLLSGAFLLKALTLPGNKA